MKTCKKCGEQKPPSAFYKESRVTDGLTARCKECMKSDASKSYWSDPEPRKARIRSNYCPRRSKDQKLRKTYGITLAEYESLLQKQKGRCRICGCKKANHNETDSLLVDHCHKSGHVRGLLCNNCNFMLGHAKDATLSLLKAAWYLKYTQPSMTPPPVPPIEFSEKELQIILQVCEDSGHLDDGGDIKDLNDKVHEHYVNYLCQDRADL